MHDRFHLKLQQGRKLRNVGLVSLLAVFISLATAISQILSSSDLQDPALMPAEVNGHGDDRPTIFLHAGTHKTGTTSLQSYLYENKDKIMENDNLLILGDVPGRFRLHKSVANLAFCLQANARFKVGCSNTFDNTTRVFESVLQRNQSVFVSSEAFDDPTIKMKELVKLVDGFSLHVLVYYRRFDEWILSVYNEVHKKRPPSAVTRAAAAFLGWWSRENIEYYAQLYSEAVVKRYQEQTFVDRVSVLEMRSSDDLLLDLLCNVLPTKKSCQLLQQSAIPLLPHSNPSRSLEAKYFIGEAVHSGLISQVLVDSMGQELIARVEDRLSQMASSEEIPQACPPDDVLQLVYDMALGFETRLMRTLLVNASSFPKSSFCHIDADLVLQDNPETWKTFFNARASTLAN